MTGKTSFISFRIKTLVVFLLLGLTLHADIPEPISPPRLVNDFAALFTPAEADQIEFRLRSYRDSTSTEIAVVTVADLEGYAVDDYAYRLADKWGIGSKKKDNGLLILISLSPRKVSIQTGYGVEEKVPDVVCARIIRNQIRPYFKQQQYAEGVHAALDEIIGRLAGTWKADVVYDQDGPSKYLILFILFILFLIIYGKMSGGRSTTFGGRGYRSSPPLWIPGGGFSRGNSGGSSFGGFGGGGFGGGGASGDW